MVTTKKRHAASDAQLALALQAADEALEELAVELSEEGPEAEANSPPRRDLIRRDWTTRSLCLQLQAQRYCC